MVGNSFIRKERELRIHEKSDEFDISREISMEIGSRARNGRFRSNLHIPKNTLSFLSLLVRDDSPPFWENLPEEDQHGFS